MGSFLDATPAFVITLMLFLAMVLMTFCGHFFAIARAKRKQDIVSDRIGSLEGALLGLVALLLAFTFSMSASRYDERRKVIVEEANVIGTAVLRADLYPDSIREAFRSDFKNYVESRITYFETPLNSDESQKILKMGADISDRLWKRASELSKDPKYFTSSFQMIPALNEVIDIVTTRVAANNAKVPASIIWLLFLLCLVASFVVGYGRKRLDSVLVIGFSLMTSLTIYLIIDLDRPRRGLITMSSANERIIELREMFLNHPDKVNDID